jgi:hypothetical protein
MELDDNYLLEIDHDGFVPFSFPVCFYDNRFDSLVQVPLILSMTIVFWMSYKTRELPEELTDSRKISKVLISHVLINFRKSLVYPCAL